jgi:hypothetical protein
MQSQNVVVAYAARDGTVAKDSGLYTAALLKYLETPGLDTWQTDGKDR